MSSIKPDSSDARDDVVNLGGVTSRTLLKIIAEASEMTFEDLVQVVRISPKALVSMLRHLADKKLIAVDDAAALDALDQTIDSLNLKYGDFAKDPNRDTTLDLGVPAFIVEERRRLVHYLPDRLRSRKVTISGRGYSKAYSL